MELPKNFLDKFSSDPLEWLEWSGQILATTDQLLADEDMKMNKLKIPVTGRAKAAVEGMGYNASTNGIAKDILAKDFGRMELVVIAQFKRLHSYHFVESHDTAEVTKNYHFGSSSVIVLSQYGYEFDLTSESVLNNAVKKLPIELKAKW